MSILDIEIVEAAEVDTEGLAGALGRAFGAAPGKVWVRIRNLPPPTTPRTTRWPRTR